MNMLALILVHLFFDGDVSVKINAPEKVKPGEEITVNIIVTKGSIAGVGHFKEELPSGFAEANIIDAKGGEFKYLPQDNVVKCTWISLPAEGEFTISYKLKVSDAAPNGKVALGGKFSYVLDNQKQTFDLPPFTIQVGADEALATTSTQPETPATSQPETSVINTQPETTTTTQPETPVTTSQVPETPATSTTQPETSATTNPAQTTSGSSSNVSASRTIVGSPEAGAEFTVEITVKKDGTKGFARVQETLPAGLTAMSLDNKGGTFSFLDQKVKIIWDNLPADEDIKVSYRVSVADNVSGDLSIIGSFSYVDNNDPKKEVIPASQFSVKPKSTLASSTNTTTDTKSQNTSSDFNNTTTASSKTNTVPTPEKNVSYKVQICALSKMQRGTSYFESKYNISNKVSMELNEGWRKYIVGKYSKYQEARDYRENIRSKGVENPFVTAYNNGKRVTVQEALMVSSQQWVR